MTALRGLRIFTGEAEKFSNSFTSTVIGIPDIVKNPQSFLDLLLAACYILYINIVSLVAVIGRLIWDS